MHSSFIMAPLTRFSMIKNLTVYSISFQRAWRVRKQQQLRRSTQAEDEVQRALLLDVVIREGAAILKLLASEDQALLVWGNALLVLDLLLHVLDGVRGLDIESDGLASELR